MKCIPHMKKYAAAALAVVTLLGSSSSALACTGLYVGKQASADGTTIIARSEDISPSDYNKIHTIVPASDKPGQMLTDINGFAYPLPDHTYQYTQMEDYASAGDGLYAAVCTNEMGVSITGTVSASGCAEWKQADPTVKTGLREAVLPALAAATSATAKQAVQVLAGAVDAYGSAEGNVVLIADQQEAWIMEFYGGHQYAAQKLAPDQVAVFGNHFMIGAVDPADTDTFLLSKDLLATIEAAGLTVKDETGSVILNQSVCGGTRSAGNNLRNWGGMKLLAPSLAGDTFDVDTFYPLLYTPDQKVTLQDVIAVYQTRYEGTPYDLSLEGQEGNRAIAVSTTPETHIVQIYEEMPACCSAVTWLALGGGEHTVFLPELSGVTQLHPAYSLDAPSYHPDSAYWSFKKVCGLADVNRALYSQGVQDFWSIHQQALIAQTAQDVQTAKTLYAADPEAATAFVNQTGAQVLQSMMKQSDAVFGQLLTTVTHNAGLSASRKPTVFDPDVPLRATAVALGYTVTWDPDTNCALLTKDGQTITVPLSGGNAYVVKGVSYVPASFAAGL